MALWNWPVLGTGKALKSRDPPWGMNHLAEDFCLEEAREPELTPAPQGILMWRCCVSSLRSLALSLSISPFSHSGNIGTPQEYLLNPLIVSILSLFDNLSTHFLLLSLFWWFPRFLYLALTTLNPWISREIHSFRQIISHLQLSAGCFYRDIFVALCFIREYCVNK